MSRRKKKSSPSVFAEALLTLIVFAIRVVDSLDEAITHITRYTTGHSEAIITESMAAANRFRNEIDAAAVYEIGRASCRERVSPRV